MCPTSQSQGYAKQYQSIDQGLSEAEYNEAIAEKCVKNEIQVVGLADHRSVDGVDSMRKALEEKGIIVLPGFEIASTEKVHMVCLYPAGTTVQALNQYLGNREVPVGGAKTTPSKLGCISIAERVSKQGGFWYAAHITGSSRLLRLNQDGGGLTHIWCDYDHMLAAQIPADISGIPEAEVKKILRNKNSDYKRARPVALINSKDIRTPEDIDNPRCYSWIKMTTPSHAALMLACKDPESVPWISRASKRRAALLSLEIPFGR